MSASAVPAPRAPLQLQLLALHRRPRGRGEHEIALIAMNLEQELGAARHASADLKGHDRTVAYDAVDHELIG